MPRWFRSTINGPICRRRFSIFWPRHIRINWRRPSQLRESRLALACCEWANKQTHVQEKWLKYPRKCVCSVAISSPPQTRYVDQSFCTAVNLLGTKYSITISYLVSVNPLRQPIRTLFERPLGSTCGHSGRKCLGIKRVFWLALIRWAYTISTTAKQAPFWIHVAAFLL